MLEMKQLNKVYRTHLIETHALRDFLLSVSRRACRAQTAPAGRSPAISPACCSMGR